MLSVKNLECCFYLFILRYYLFMKDAQREREREEQKQAEGEAGSMQGVQLGLDPETLGSCPEPKADAQPLSHPAVPELFRF